jgi:hypothetical protein
MDCFWWCLELPFIGYGKNGVLWLYLRKIKHFVELWAFSLSPVATCIPSVWHEVSTYFCFQLGHLIDIYSTLVFRSHK